MKFDAGALIGGLGKLANKHGLEVQDLLNDQMRLWCQDVIRILPPKRAAQGVKRIRGDLSRIFARRSQGFLAKMAERYGKRLEKVGNVRPQFDFFAYDANIGDMKKLHDLARDARGRTKRLRGPRAVKLESNALIDRGKIVGTRGLTFAYKMHVTDSRFRNYQSLLINRVGTLKAGFVEPADHFAALSRVKASIPKFVRAAAARTSGIGSHEGVLDRSGSGRIASVNEVDFVARHANSSLFKAAQRRRERDVANNLKKRMSGKRGLVARFNKGKI